VTDEAKDWRFPAACATCSAEAGIPIRVDEGPTLVEVWVRCGACEAEWKITGDAPALIQRRKADHRVTIRPRIADS
jgi:hypothetical protein